VLRDPVSRARSHFDMLVARGYEPQPDFDTVIDDDLADRLVRSYVRLGFYADALERYLDCFGADQCSFLLYDDLRADPVAFMAAIYEFLGVDPTFVPAVETEHNVTAVPKSDRIARMTRRSSPVKSALKAVTPARWRSAAKQRVGEWNRRPRTAISPATRARLLAVYTDDIDRTEQILGRDLSAWRTP